MLRTGPCRKIGAAFADQLERERWADSVDLRQVHAQHAIQSRADLKVRRVHLSSFGPDFWEVADVMAVVDFERLERDFKLSITFENFGLAEIEQGQGLGEREDVLVPPVP